MSVRVGTMELAQSSLQAIMDAYARYDSAQKVVATGLQIQTVSDNPAGAAQVMDFNAQSAELQQYATNIQQAQTFLSTTDSSLRSATSLVQQARTLVIQAANGSYSSTDLAGMASQIQSIITQIADLGNTTQGNRYVFGGQETESPPIVNSGSGYAYAGGTAAAGTGSLTLTVDRGQSIQTNVTGDQVFTPLLAALQTAHDDIAAGSTSQLSQQDLAAMDSQLNNLLGIRADIGGRLNQLTQLSNRNSSMQQSLTQFTARLQDANVPQAAVALQSAQTAYQAALQVTASGLQVSLLDYLK